MNQYLHEQRPFLQSYVDLSGDDTAFEDEQPYTVFAVID